MPSVCSKCAPRTARCPVCRQGAYESVGTILLYDASDHIQRPYVLSDVPLCAPVGVLLALLETKYNVPVSRYLLGDGLKPRILPLDGTSLAECGVRHGHIIYFFRPPEGYFPMKPPVFSYDLENALSDN